MMKKIILNGKLMENNPHEYMKKSLNFPEYYGKNLDALFDCLSEIGEKTEITLIYSKKIKKTIITTFKDAEKENPYLSIKIE
ncbi:MULTISPECIES: barstar family protein [unclassified Methanobrevibacter]|jgi:ribonuclease inhibitor|uniref:barstar family protein n=2 Tax=Methanobacteriaceae TaxID=2159 RepID=UPI0039B93E33